MLLLGAVEEIGPGERLITRQHNPYGAGGLRHGGQALPTPSVDQNTEAVLARQREQQRPRLTRQVAEDQGSRPQAPIRSSLQGPAAHNRSQGPAHNGLPGPAHNGSNVGERSRLTRQSAVEQRQHDIGAGLSHQSGGGHVMLAHDTLGGRLGPPHYCVDARMTCGTARQPELMHGGDVTTGGGGARLNQGVFDSAQTPLGALQSLMQAHTVPAHVQLPAHMTRQMTDARNVALRTAAVVSLQQFE